MAAFQASESHSTSYLFDCLPGAHRRFALRRAEGWMSVTHREKSKWLRQTGKEQSVVANAEAGALGNYEKLA
jgi:hypothetical protein